MSEEPDLFNWKPPPAPPRAFARATDPETCEIAAASMQSEVAALEAAVLEVVVAAGAFGAMLDNAVRVIGRDKVTLSPRFAPLERKGLIRRNGTRLGNAGRPQTVWVAA